MSSLIIFNLPNTITKIDLMKTFSQKGNVTNIQIIFSVENEYCLFALITFQTEDEAKITQNYFNKTNQYSSRISIERCTERIDNEMVKDIDQYPKLTPQNNEVTEHGHKEPTYYNMSSYLVNSPHGKINLPSYLDKFPYAEGQSSAINQTGKRIYSKSFMLSLENEPICLKEPMGTNIIMTNIKKSSNHVQTAATAAKKTKKKKKKSLMTVADETITNVQPTLDIEPVVTSTDYLENQKKLDQEIADNKNLECEIISHAFPSLQNLEDIVHALTKYADSTDRTRHQDFVKTMILKTFINNDDCGPEVGKIFVELLSYKHKDNIQILSMADVTLGINKILKDSTHDLMKYTQVVFYIADIITQLLMSKTVCFEGNNLLNCCVSVCHEYSINFYVELIKTVCSYVKKS